MKRLFSNHKEKAKSKILITGAGGHLGRNLVPYLLRDGFKVTAFLPEGKDEPMEWGQMAQMSRERLEIIHGDIFILDKFLPIIDEHDDIIHLTGIPFQGNKKNYDQEAIKQIDFIAAITLGRDINFIWPRFAISEKSEENEYFKALKRIETFLKRQIYKHRVIHCAPIIGKGMPFWDNIVYYAGNNKKISLPDWAENPLQFLHINDFKYAVLEIIKRPGEWGYTIKLSGDEYISLKELLEKVLAFLGKEANLSQSKVLSGTTKVMDSVTSISKKFKGNQNGPEAVELGKKLIYNEMFENILANWEKIDNIDSFFGDIFHRPAKIDKVFNDYIF